MSKLALVTCLLLVACTVSEGSSSQPQAMAPSQPTVSADARPSTPPPTREFMFSQWLQLRDVTATHELSCGSWRLGKGGPKEFTFGEYLTDILAELAASHDIGHVDVSAEAEWKTAAELQAFWGETATVPTQGAWQCDVTFVLEGEEDPWHAGLRLYIDEAHRRIGPVGCLY